MNCKDCLHFKACYEMATANGAEEFNTLFANQCEDFTDRSEWEHLPCKVGNLVYVIRRKEKRNKGGYWDSICFTKKVMQTAIKDGTAYIDCKRATKTDFSLVGKTVFLTREEAEKALEGMK